MKASSIKEDIDLVATIANGLFIGVSPLVGTVFVCWGRSQYHCSQIRDSLPDIKNIVIVGHGSDSGIDYSNRICFHSRYRVEILEQAMLK